MELKREAGKTFISGMEKTNWGGGFFTREDSQVRCLTDALNCAGRNVTYSDVMGLSGAAFKITMSPDLDVCQIHSEIGMNWEETVLRVWGFEYLSAAVSCSDGENPEWRAKVHELAAESIGKRRIPLFYMDGEWNLLVGFHDDRSGFVCKPYAGDKEGYEDAATPKGLLGNAWLVSVLTPKDGGAKRMESVIRSLRFARDSWTKPAEKNGNRRFGVDSYRVWVEALESNRANASKHGNAFAYSQLITSRRAAVDYLRSVATDFPAEAAKHLNMAAARYAAVSERLFEGKQCVMWPWEENWTDANRTAETKLLKACVSDEETAISEIASVLAQ